MLTIPCWLNAHAMIALNAGKKVFRLRHDKEFGNIRFYCPKCSFETSYHIMRPKHTFRTVEVHDKRGILVGVKTVDDWPEKTPGKC